MATASGKEAKDSKDSKDSKDLKDSKDNPWGSDQWDFDDDAQKQSKKHDDEDHDEHKASKEGNKKKSPMKFGDGIKKVRESASIGIFWMKDKFKKPAGAKSHPPNSEAPKEPKEPKEPPHPSSSP